MPQAREEGTKAIQIGIAAFIPWRNRGAKLIDFAYPTPRKSSIERRVEPRRIYASGFDRGELLERLKLVERFERLEPLNPDSAVEAKTYVGRDVNL